MPDLSDLEKLYSLDDKQRKIIGEIIVADFTRGVKPVVDPVVIILGGQPGAGKSELITQA